MTPKKSWPLRAQDVWGCSFCCHGSRDTGRRSFGFCGFLSGVSTDWTYFGTSGKSLIGLRVWRPRGLNTVQMGETARGSGAVLCLQLHLGLSVALTCQWMPRSKVSQQHFIQTKRSMSFTLSLSGFNHLAAWWTIVPEWISFQVPTIAHSSENPDVFFFEGKALICIVCHLPHLHSLI